MRMGDREVQNIPSISTGSLGLDVALELVAQKEEWLKFWA